jgi:hypothetical protein
MNTQSPQNNQEPSLYLFLKEFEPFIRQSCKFITRYQFRITGQGSETICEIIIRSVNGYSSPDEFLEQLTLMMDSSISAVFESLQQSPFSSWQPPLEYIESRLQDLTSVVEEESVIYNDRSGKCSRHRHFKSFTNCYLEGLNEDNSLMFGQSIRLATVKYAEVWLQVISDTINRLHLKYETIKQSYQATLVPPVQLPV